MVWRVNLRQLEAFRALMLTGTTTGAAHALHVSQPVISRLIQELEAQTNLTLFERHRGRLVPTKHARWLLDESEETLSRLDKLDGAIRNAPKHPVRPLRLVANSAMSFGVLPAAVAAFRQKYPDVSVATDVAMRRDNRRWINDQVFDLALTMLPVEYPEELVQPLMRVPPVCVMPAGHDLARLDRVRPMDLDGQDLVSLSPDNVTPARLNRLSRDQGFAPRLVAEAQTVVVVCAYVAQGLGVAIVDPYTARQFAPLGLVTRPFDAQMDYLFGVIYPIQGAVLPVTAALVDCISVELHALAGLS